MTIYNWCGDEYSAEYGGISENDEQKIMWFDNLLGDPLPALSNWQPPTLTQYRGDNGKRAPRPVLDCVYSLEMGLISDRAADALEDIWNRHAILYPVILDDADCDYFMVVTKTVLDCIDRGKSTGPLQKYGLTPDYFASVHTWVFDMKCVGDADMFVIPDSKTNVFVSERFRERVEQEDLKGFCLRTQFWEEEPWVS